MQNFGFTVKKNLASTIRDYLKSKGRNVSEEDINEILQRLADVNSKRSKKESIFSGGHKYFGGSGKENFIVQKEQEINLSVNEYNEVFDGYLKLEKEPPKLEPVEIEPKEFVQANEPEPKPDEMDLLSDEDLKNLKNEAFKSSLSNMSDKQLTQIAHSDNLTNNTEQLGMLAQELGVRGYQKDAREIAKLIKMIESQQENVQDAVLDAPVSIRKKDETPEISPTAAKNNTPAETPETEEKPKSEPADIEINPANEEIKKNIDNLKTGESYTYLEVKEQKTWGFGQNQKPVTWTRNEDNTLTKMTPDFKIDGEFGALTEIYSSDGTELLSRTKLGSNNLTKGLYTTTKYSNSKPITETTDLKNINQLNDKIPGHLSNSMKILGLMTPEVITDKNTREKAMTKDNQTFTSKELKNAKGETVLTYKDGKFSNHREKEIDKDKALKIIERYVKNNNLSELVKNYKV